MNAEHPALQAERARAAALVARDAAALAALLHPDLRYVHATGIRHDRDGYLQTLQTLQTGPRFLEVVLTPEQMFDLAEGAALSGRLFMRLQREGEAVIEARSWVTALWLRSAGGWRLRLFQSTREAARA
jgi:hypothetical protein